jgi:hypothetical protein
MNNIPKDGTPEFWIEVERLSEYLTKHKSYKDLRQYQSTVSKMIGLIYAEKLDCINSQDPVVLKSLDILFIKREAVIQAIDKHEFSPNNSEDQLFLIFPAASIYTREASS